MNESERRGSVTEAVIVLCVLFLIIGLLIYSFGTRQNTVSNPLLDNAASDTSNTFQDNQEDTIYNKYIKQIYDAQASGTKDVSPIIDNYQTELSRQVTIPDQQFEVAKTDKAITNADYASQFENLFGTLKLRGGTTESSIFKAQISPDNTLLPLSDYDKETLERIASDYEDFAGSLKSLPTTPNNKKIVEEVGRNSLNIVYVLRQMEKETDEKVYTLWISKYMENMSAIITDRYAISGK